MVISYKMAVKVMPEEIKDVLFRSNAKDNCDLPEAVKEQKINTKSSYNKNERLIFIQMYFL